MKIRDHLLSEIEKMPEHQLHAIKQVLIRRKAQDIKWGPISNNLHPASKWVLLIEEEVNELKKEVIEGDLVSVVDELIDVVATSLSALEALEYLAGHLKADEFSARQLGGR